MKPAYTKAADILTVLLITLLLCACDALSTARSHHLAHRYYEGPALQLAIAAERGDAQTIGRLIQQDGVDPDTTFSREGGIPLLAWPLRARNLDGLRALLDNGADPNARLAKHMNGKLINFDNAMVYAARMDDPRYLELLLDHGGDPNTRSSNRETLMYVAFLSGNKWKNVQLLANNGANLNEPNLGSADTILSLYTSRGGFDAAYWLLQQGADPTIRTTILTDSGETPPMRMVDAIYWEITTPDLLPWQKQCQQWLIEHNIPRPPMPQHIRRKREAFGYPTDEADIPLL